MRALMGTGFALALAVAGCGGDGMSDDGDDGDDAPAGGMASLSYSVSNSVRDSASLMDPLMGTVYGQVFLSSEVTLTGPNEDAMEFSSAEVPGVDLRTAMEAGAWTTGELPPGEYTFLGFFDVDGNGATDRSPDNGDPVTLPLVNQFTIESGGSATLVVSFDLVYNF
jgi:hypothetical protein